MSRFISFASALVVSSLAISARAQTADTGSRTLPRPGPVRRHASDLSGERRPRRADRHGHRHYQPVRAQPRPRRLHGLRGWRRAAGLVLRRLGRAARSRAAHRRQRQHAAADGDGAPGRVRSAAHAEARRSSGSRGVPRPGRGRPADDRGPRPRRRGPGFDQPRTAAPRFTTRSTSRCATSRRRRPTDRPSVAGRSWSCRTAPTREV